jgi:hypothetical protein
MRILKRYIIDFGKEFLIGESSKVYRVTRRCDNKVLAMKMFKKLK